MKLIWMLAAPLALLLLTASAGANQADVNVIVPLADEPPSLDDEPRQNITNEYIGPGECVVVTVGGVDRCETLGAQYECPFGLSAGAIHRTEEASYALAVGPVGATANRDTHCKYVGSAVVYPVPADDPGDPVVTCVVTVADDAGLWDNTLEGPCQTSHVPPSVPVPTPTYAPQPPAPTPTATPAPTPVSVPAPMPAFTG